MTAPFEPAAQPARTRRIIPRSVFVAVGLVVFVILLLGGYVGNWAWTGFSENDTLWDWLHLLLLPIVIATIPIWLLHGEFMDRRVRRLLVAVAVAFVVLVLLGYLVPLTWTGFTGNTLWDWLGLIMLPFAVATIRLWSELRPRLDARHFAVLSMQISLLIFVVVAGYVVPWAWTGFTGNTLWDWLVLLLVPLLLPTLLMPAARDFIRTGIDERKELAEGAGGEEGDASEDAFEAESDAPQETPPPPPARPAPVRGGVAVAAVAAGVALLVGGVVGALAFGGNDTSSPPKQASAGAASSANPCAQAGAATLTATADGRVVRVGQSYYGCLGAARPILLTTGKAGEAPANFVVSASRVAFTDKRCNAAKTDCTTKLMIGRARDGRVFNPQTFNGARVTGLALTPGGGMAVMLRDPSKLVLIDNGQTRDAADGPGLDPGSLAQAGSTVYWRMNGQSVSAQLSA